MKKLIILLLVGCMCFCTVACGNSTVTNPGETLSPSGTADIFPAETKEVLQYLKNKYGEDFLCEGVTHDSTVFHCSSKSYSLIKVHTVASLVERGANAADFVGKYADDGYYLRIKDVAQKHYESYFTVLGEYKVLVYMPLEAFPSNIDPQRTFAENRILYPQYFMPELYVLYDGEITDVTINTIRDAMRIASEYGVVYLVNSSQSRWDSVTLDTVLWNVESLNITHKIEIN